MFKKLTTTEFIEKAKSVHGDMYDYGKVNYITSNRKVIVVCKSHGDFLIRANSHTSGCGCPLCGREKAKYTGNVSSLEYTWLNYLKVPDDHMHRQVYIEGKLVDGFDPVKKIIYEFDGDFWHGNPKIYNKNDTNRVNKSKFGDLYSSTVEKKNFLKKKGYTVISIWESDWREFCRFNHIKLEKPHVNKKYKHPLSIDSKLVEERILKSQGDCVKILDIENYYNAYSKLTVTWRYCDHTEKRPYDSLIRYKGCAKCNIIARGKNPLNIQNRRICNGASFIKKSKNKFGNVFVYDKVNYINCKTPVILVHPKHGEFKIKPTRHLELDAGYSKCMINKKTKHDTIEKFFKY